MREKLIYECEHCGKKRLINKTAMKRHEDNCWWNLTNKTCVTCAFDNGWFDKQGDDYGEFRKCFKGVKFDNAKPKDNCNLWKHSLDELEDVNDIEVI